MCIIFGIQMTLKSKSMGLLCGSDYLMSRSHILVYDIIKSLRKISKVSDMT